MDQNLVNFWKNYEDVINWGYRVSGARKVVSNETSPSSPLNTIGPDTNTNVVDEKYDKDAPYDSDSSDDIDLEYLKFAKKTLEHQSKIKKEKRKLNKEYGLCKSPCSENETVFEEEINPKELYGSKVDEILSLESKLLSEYTKFYVKNKPTIWPGLAFNLDLPEPELHLDPKILNHPFSE